jgi:hypothetical protein
MKDVAISLEIDVELMRVMLLVLCARFPGYFFHEAY